MLRVMKCVIGGIAIVRLPRLRVRTYMLLVGVVALLVWGTMIGMRWYEYSPSGQYANHRGEMGLADRRLLRTAGAEVSPRDVAPVDLRRVRTPFFSRAAKFP